MSCDCENITCLNLYISPCSSSIDTGFIASVAGNWIILYEFNGIWKQQNLSFLLNDPILLVNDFNGNYKHTLKIFKPNGDLFNNTCYEMNINLVLNASDGGVAPILGNTVTTNITYTIKDNPNPDAGNGSEASPFELQSGSSITIPLFINKIVHEPQIYNIGNEYLIFNKNSLNKTIDAVFTRSLGNDFNDGDLITFSYEA